MPQLPTPRPSQPPKATVYGPPSPPKRAVPQPSATRPEPSQEEYASILAQQQSSTGPQRRRVGGSYDKQREIDAFPGLDAIRSEDDFKNLSKEDQRLIERFYHDEITRNTTRYKADATKVDKAKNPKFTAGSNCANCALFQAKAGAAAGGCPLFAGKQVAAKGWCSAYAKKA